MVDYWALRRSNTLYLPSYSIITKCTGWKINLQEKRSLKAFFEKADLKSWVPKFFIRIHRDWFVLFMNSVIFICLSSTFQSNVLFTSEWLKYFCWAFQSILSRKLLFSVSSHQILFDKIIIKSLMNFIIAQVQSHYKDVPVRKMIENLIYENVVIFRIIIAWIYAHCWWNITQAILLNCYASLMPSHYSAKEFG